MDKKIKDILVKAKEGGEINREELIELFALPTISEEAYAIHHLSRKMSESASQGAAEIHGQVGVNIGPCPKNCMFCSFAAPNKVFREFHVLDTAKIIEQCLLFEQAKVNAVYLMVTANFPLRDYLKIAREVRKSLKAETVLVANVGDFDLDGARALREAGLSGIYHAVRLGEGIKTGIDPKVRINTIQAAKQAGLKVGTCVEPVGPEHSLEELAEKTLLTREMAPAFSGAARRISIPGTELEQYGMVSEARMALYLAVVRLAVGYQVVGNCTHEPNGIGAMAGANLFWAENGSNPRDITDKTENARGFSVDRCRDIFQDAGWKILEGPSKMFSA